MQDKNETRYTFDRYMKRNDEAILDLETRKGFKIANGEIMLYGEDELRVRKKEEIYRKIIKSHYEQDGKYSDSELDWLRNPDEVEKIWTDACNATDSEILKTRDLCIRNIIEDCSEIDFRTVFRCRWFYLPHGMREYYLVRILDDNVFEFSITRYRDIEFCKIISEEGYKRFLAELIKAGDCLNKYKRRPEYVCDGVFMSVCCEDADISELYHLSSLECDFNAFYKVLDKFFKAGKYKKAR